MGKPSVILFIACVQILASIRTPPMVWAYDDDDLFKENRDVNYHGAPEIHPIIDEIELEKGSARNFTCKSSEPIWWHLNHETMPENIEIHPYDTGDHDKVYGSILMIKEAAAENVGRYYCIKNHSIAQTEEPEYDDLVAEYEASSLYVFVRDPDVPLVPITTPFYNVNQHSDFIIPCKPTTRDIEVELYKDGEKDAIQGYIFYVQEGFQLNFNKVEDGGSYYCRVKGSEDYIQHFEITIKLHYDIEAVTEYIRRPVIESDTGDIAVVSGRMRLVCIAKVREGILFNMVWKIPPTYVPVPKDNSRIHESEVVAETDPDDVQFVIGRKELIIEQVTLDDEGTYRCEVSDLEQKTTNRNFKMTVKGNNEDFIKLSEDNGVTSVTVRRTRPAVIAINYSYHPHKPKFSWVRSNGVELYNGDNNNKYRIAETNRKVSLTIENTQADDTGLYTLRAESPTVTKTYDVQVYILDKPTVHMDNVIVAPNEASIITCRVVGYPLPDISIATVNCTGRPWKSCQPMFATGAVTEWGDTVSPKRETEIAVSKTVTLVSGVPQTVRCTGQNDEGSEQVFADLMISGLSDSIVFKLNNGSEQFIVGDRVVFSCEADIYNYTEEMHFWHNQELLSDGDGVTITKDHTDYTWRTYLTFSNVGKHLAGQITCETVASDGQTESRTLPLDVYDPVAPRLLEGTSREVLDLEKGEKTQLRCLVTGMPPPKITWWKDSVLLDVNDEENNMKISSGGDTLSFEFLKNKHMGEYTCLAENKVNEVSKTWQLNVKTIEVRTSLIYVILSLFLILILAVVMVSVFYYKKRKQVKAMKEAGLAHFEEGDLDCINPEVALDEQADLLPYKSEYEFPKERLKIGKQLGAGAFGVVMKATAAGIIVTEDETTVAVKMVKKQTDNEVMRALISELKIMVHLGQHLNVVNLLGAVTKNIAKRELMVIVEYCRFGNVQHFLLKSRPYFIDQVDTETGEIDPLIQSNKFRWSKSGYATNRQRLNYVNLSFSTNNVNQHPTAFYNNHINSASYIDPRQQVNSKGYMRHSGMQNMAMVDSCNTEATAMTSVDGGTLNTDNSCEPLWRSNYSADVGDASSRSVTTTDLVCWAAQVACGMEYLSSRKVLHGDLAARNILLCDDNVVKICDFGLARSMYKNDNYKKKGEAPLPFKWLALECISDNVFSTYSDVWAYGIVLWEFFSLSRVPYPGMEANQELYNKLRDGHRMDKPVYATQDIYDIMLNCWNVKPDSRPSFKDLKCRFNAMLPEEMRNHYIELNEPYLAMNVSKTERGETDYLASLSPPEELAPTAPNYVNAIILPLPPISEAASESGYRDRSIKHADSEESHFDFASFNSSQHSPTLRNNLDNSPPSGSKRHKKAGIPEEIPMLQSNGAASLNGSHSDESDQEPISPIPPLRSSKQQRHPEYTNVTASTLNGHSNGLGSAKSKSTDNNLVSNPGYVTIHSENEKRF